MTCSMTTPSVPLIGHFFLPRVTDLLKRTPSSRIVVVSSAAHPYGFFDIDNLNCEKSFNGFFLYCNSKLCNIFMVQHLAEKLKGTGQYCQSRGPWHPGATWPFCLNNRVTRFLGSRHHSQQLAPWRREDRHLPARPQRAYQKHSCLRRRTIFQSRCSISISRYFDLSRFLTQVQSM